ncbi:MAG: hypothetical protein ACLPTF_01735 [Steroidobacteraceae bacterium]
MRKVEPQFAVKALNHVSAGALVIFHHAVAFTGINRSVPATQQIVTLATHDAQNGRFVYRYFDSAQPTVLVPTGEVVIRPNLHSFTPDVSLQPASTPLFYKDEPYLVVELPENDFRLLGLNTGSLVSTQLSQMDAFIAWEVGVMSLGEFLPLLKI